MPRGSKIYIKGIRVIARNSVMGQESHPQQVTGEVNWDFQKSWPKKSIDPSIERKPFENQRETLRREVHFRKLVGHRGHHFENKP